MIWRFKIYTFTQSDTRHSKNQTMSGYHPKLGGYPTLQEKVRRVYVSYA